MSIMNWIRKLFSNDDLPPGLKREDPEVIRQIMSTPGDPNDPEPQKHIPYEFARQVSKILEREKLAKIKQEENDNAKITIAIDFDGVLHSIANDDDLPYYNVQNPPNKGAIEWLSNLLSDTRFKIFIYSCRCRCDEGILAMQQWFLKYGLKKTLIDKIAFAKQRKPNARVFIDDKCICFTGNFPTSHELIAFKPYYMNKD